MLTNKSSFPIDRVKFYSYVILLWLITSLINHYANLESSEILLLDYYTNIFGTFVICELLFNCCFVPEYLDMFFISVSLIIWRSFAQIDQFKESFTTISNWNPYMIVGCILIGLIYCVVVIHELYYYSDVRIQITTTFLIQAFNIGILLTMYYASKNSNLHIHHWQIFYFLAFYFPNKNYRLLYAISIGIMLDGLISYGLTYPYNYYLSKGPFRLKDTCMYSYQPFTWTDIIDCTWCRGYFNGHKKNCYITIF